MHLSSYGHCYNTDVLGKTHILVQGWRVCYEFNQPLFAYI